MRSYVLVFIPSFLSYGDVELPKNLTVFIVFGYRDVSVIHTISHVGSACGEIDVKHKRKS